MNRLNALVPSSLTSVCRVVWMAVLVISVLLLGQQLSAGLNIDTRFTAMVPLGKRDIDRSEALEAARTLSDQTVILLLQSPNESQVDAAVAALHASLAKAADVLSVSTQDSLPDAVLQWFSQYPHNFLSSAMRQQLEAQDTGGEGVDELVQQRIDILLAPTGDLAVLEFNLDPFNTLGAYVSEAIDRASAQYAGAEKTDRNPGIHSRSLNLRLHGNNGERVVQRQLETLFDEVRQLLRRDFTDVTLQRSGVFFFARQAASAAKRDINIISAGSLLGTVLLLMLVFRSLWPLFVPVLSILVGVVFAFAVVHTIYGNVHVFSIVFGASLIGIVIDYSIHYFYHSSLGVRQTATEPVSGTSKHHQAPLQRALLISLLTSVVGYAALALAGIELLEKIAVFSVAGVTASWLTVMSLAGPLSQRLRPVKTILLVSVQSALLFVARAAVRLLSLLNLPVLLLLLVACTGLVALLLKSNDDPRSFIQTSAALLAENQQVMQHLQASEPGRFLLASGGTEQQMFDSLAALYQAVAKAPVDDIALVSVLDWLPSPQQQQRNHALAAALYEPGGAAESLYTTLGIDIASLASLRDSHSAAAGKVLSSSTLFAADQTALPALVHRSTNAWHAYALMEAGSDSTTLREIAALIDGVDYVDTVSESQAQLALQRRASLGMLAAAYAVVGFLLFLVYRQPRCLRMLLIPATSTIATLLVLSAAQVPLNVFHTMALFLILGLGMDYSVFLSEMSEDADATRQAILLSALTSMLSFGLLALSSVPVAQGFGLTVFLGNSFNLLGAFVVSALRARQTELLD